MNLLQKGGIYKKFTIEFTTAWQIRHFPKRRHNILFPVSILKSSEKGGVGDGVTSVWRPWAQFMYHLLCQNRA